MGFDYYNKPKKKYRKDYEFQPYSYNRSSGNGMGLNILKKILSNRKLKIFAIIAVSLILIVVIGLIVFLYPFLIKIFNYISENGVQGLIEFITEVINKIWTGSK